MAHRSERRQLPVTEANPTACLHIGMGHIQVAPGSGPVHRFSKINGAVKIELVAGVTGLAHHVRTAISGTEQISVPLRRLAAGTASGTIELQVALAQPEAASQQQSIAQPLVVTRGLRIGESAGL